MGWFYFTRTVRYWFFFLFAICLYCRRRHAGSPKVGSSGITSARRDSRGDDVSRLPYTWLSSLPIPELDAGTRFRAEDRMKMKKAIDLIV